MPTLPCVGPPLKQRIKSNVWYWCNGVTPQVTTNMFARTVQAMHQEQCLVLVQWCHTTSYNKYVCPHCTNSKDKFDSGVCEKNAHLFGGHNIERAPPPDPPSSMLCRLAPLSAQRWAFFFAPPECPLGNKINIELGVRGCEISTRDSAGWAFFSHTPVTTSTVISVPHGVASQTKRSPLKQLAIAELSTRD